MKRTLKRLLLASFLFLTALLGACEKETQLRFDSVYFFQNEDVLVAKKVDFKEVSAFTLRMQTQIAKVLKGAKIPTSSGYVVVAIRSDQEIAVWLDMEPSLHEFYDYGIVEAVKKVQPFKVDDGIVVFAIKMAIATPVHTTKAIPEPKEWIAAKKKLADPDDVERLVLSIWPE
jgi:hypothetical protein